MALEHVAHDLKGQDGEAALTENAPVKQPTYTKCPPLEIKHPLCKFKSKAVDEILERLKANE